MTIRKNDIVISNNSVTKYNTVLPAGTKFKVWKAKRDGTLYLNAIDFKDYTTTILHSFDVMKISVPLPTVNVGDIYVCSWGYDQTNIDYYKVVNVKNKTVNLVSIGQKRNYTGTMQGECVPDPSVEGNKIYTKRIINNGDTVSFKMTSYSWAYKWNGQTNHFTEWA